MARITLSIDDEVAAQLDALAAENNLNRSQAAEHIFRDYFRRGGEPQAEEGRAVPDSSATSRSEISQQLEEIRAYLGVFHAAHNTLSNFVVSRIETEPHDALTGYLDYPQELPAPVWSQPSRKRKR